MPKVWNKRHKDAPADAVYVGRPTKWGNPYAMRNESDRERVCEAFEQHALKRLETDPHWLDPLRGKDLICFCAPKRCHAETLIRLANGE